MSRAFWTGFVQGLDLIGRQLVENVRGLLFVAGAVWLYVGLSGFSRPVANIAAGLLLMVVGGYPYLQSKGKR